MVTNREVEIEAHDDREDRFMFAQRAMLVIILITLTTPFWPIAYLFILQIPYFYYADYRAIEHKLSNIPEVTIVDTWLHEDLTLEDFGFELDITGCPPIHISFNEGWKWRGLFHRIDGILVSGPGQINTAYTIEDLNTDDLRIQNLDEALRQMPKVLERIDTLKGTPIRWPQPKGYWVYIRYEK